MMKRISELLAVKFQTLSILKIEFHKSECSDINAESLNIEPWKTGDMLPG